jgi:hypothetical protein
VQLDDVKYETKTGVITPELANGAANWSRKPLTVLQGIKILEYAVTHDPLTPRETCPIPIPEEPSARPDGPAPIWRKMRASELCELQWSDIEFETATLHIRRTKGGTATTHPLLGDEMRALRVLKRDAKSPFIFVSERDAPFTVAGLQKLVERAGVAAKIGFKVHPYMLRHATGFVLANRGTDTRTLQAYLGHRSIQSTVRYTELAPGRFKNLWRT